MTKRTNRRKLPHITEVLEELGLIQPSSLTMALNPKAKVPERMNMAAACRKLKITKRELKTILKNGENHVFPPRARAR